MVKHSKRFSAVAERVNLDRAYAPEEAIELVKEVSTAKFDETVEIHLRTNVDPRHADQMVRGVTVLPHGLGKQVRVLVFTGADGADLARQAGADYVAFGAFFESTTKQSEHRPAPEILEWWSALFEIPCVAIGGITPENCAPLIAAGADFLAVSGAIWNGDEVAAVKAFAEQIGKA